MNNVIPFRRPIVNLAELEVENLKVATAMAWVDFQKAAQAFVNARNSFDESHRRWLDLDIKLFAATAAEKINHG